MFFFFFFNDTATTEIYTLSLHDALPISRCSHPASRPTHWSASATSARPSASSFSDKSRAFLRVVSTRDRVAGRLTRQDRKSTRLNSSHGYISYAVFCLKKKKRHSATCND